MFNKNIKLVIAAAIVAWAIWQMVEGNIGNGILLILLAGIFLFLYFKNEMILLAFLRLRKQDFPGAKKWLDKTPFGNLSITAAGYNLWYDAYNTPDRANFDPNVAGIGVGNGRGFDYLNGPSSRRYGLSVKATF